MGFTINGGIAEFEMTYKNKKIDNKIRILGSKFVKRNLDKPNCILLINNYVENNLKEFHLVDEKEELIKVKLLILDKNLKDLSYLFCGCSSLISLNIKINDLKFSINPFFAATDMSYMFYNCSSLRYLPDISNWKMSNVTNISFMFAGCSILETLPDISKWDLKNMTNISNLFSECFSLKYIPDISKWNTLNLKDISFLFYGCSSLTTLPDISKWETKNINNMKGIFSYTKNLKYLPEIPKWNTINVKNMSHMFNSCTTLYSIADISKWNTENLSDISYMFCKCSSLKFLPNISKWNTSKINNMSFLFYDCSLMAELPDISFWDTSNVIDMSFMFYNCSKIIDLPNISKWKIDKVKNLSYMFYNCSSLNIYPDISKWNPSKDINTDRMFLNCTSLTKIPKFSRELNKFIFINKFKENNNDKIDLIGAIRNANFDFIPQIEMKFNSIKEYNSKDLYHMKKEIRQILKNDNFSIIEIKKGSLTVILYLQYLILKEIRILENLNAQDNYEFNNINDEILQIYQDLKDNQFFSLGTNRADYIYNNFIDLNDKNNKKRLRDRILEIKSNSDYNDNNWYESSRNIKLEDLEGLFQRLSAEADLQEKNNLQILIDRLDEFNNAFDQEIEKAMKNSVFEYKIIHTVLVDKDKSQFTRTKNNLGENKKDILLFHGTRALSAIEIVSNQFKEGNKAHQIGKGIYMTDSLDYLWYYADDFNELHYSHNNLIPRVGVSFNFIVSKILYHQDKFEYVYDKRKKDLPVESNGIRCAHDDYSTRVLSEKDLRNYNHFYAKEFVISDLNQILPLYVVIVKRMEYLVIWRDYNFNSSNPNLYPQRVFKEIQSFHRELKSFITRNLNSKIYYVENDDEAMKLLDRKKYNKILIISNGANNAQKFIENSRAIIGAEVVAGVSIYDIKRHIHWVKNMNNVLILNGIEFHQRFFRCVINNDINLYRELKNEIINKYNVSGFNENTQELFNFPKFKDNGHFKELTFNNNQ